MNERTNERAGGVTFVEDSKYVNQKSIAGDDDDHEGSSLFWVGLGKPTELNEFWSACQVCICIFVVAGCKCTIWYDIPLQPIISMARPPPLPLSLSLSLRA